MKNTCKIFFRGLSLFLTAGMIVPLLFSCRQPDVPDTPDEPTASPTEAEPTVELPGLCIFAEGAALFRIVRGDTAEKEEINAAVSLRHALMDASGLDVKITTDWDDKKENADIKEILIGETNRAESIAVMAEIASPQDFVIRVVNNKIVILGGSPYATAKAATVFAKAYVNGKSAATIGTPVTLDYVYVRSEHIADLYVDEANIEDYELCGISVLTNEQNLDKDYLYKNTGAALDYIRFADCNAEIIYRFVITDLIEPQISLSVMHAFTVEISETPDNWKKIVSLETGANTYYCVINPFEYGYYDTVYVRLTDPTPQDGGGAAIANFNIVYYKKGDMTQNPYYLSDEMSNLISEISEEHDPIEVDGYQTAEDGGLIYNRLSREQADKLDKYDGADTFEGTLTLKDKTFTYSVPKNVTAYDVIPVHYTVTTDTTVNNSSPLHISVTGQEDVGRENGQLYYDLNLPGKVDLAFTYDGYVRADGNNANKPVLNTNFKGDKTASAYPDYETDALCLSGNIQNANYVWFHFTYTNIGNTVLDGDGNGTFCFEPFLYKKNGGTWEQVSAVPSMYLRIIDEVYPGESGDMWVYFPMDYTEGEYYVQINCIVRNEIDHPEIFGRTIWGGEVPVVIRQHFTVDGTDKVTSPKAIEKTVSSVKRNKWLHYYEEFQSSYLSCLKMKAKTTQSGTIYVQLSPWCNQLVIKLINGDGNDFSAVSLPIEVESDSVTVTFNPNNPNYVVYENGTRFPAIMTQSMADMRVNIENNPDTAGRIVQYLAEIKDLGFNIVNSTAGFMYDTGVGGSAFKFSVDVARKLGLKVEGFVSYPYTSDSNYSTASAISQDFLQAGGTSSAALAKANAVMAAYQFLRWGDTYWVTNGNTTVLSVEDSRGGANITGSSRAAMDFNSKQNFRIFLRSLYGDIETLNRVWDTDYGSFADIDPEAEAVSNGASFTYDNAGNFRQWSMPLSDLDFYRTLERAYSYKTMLEELSETVPGAKVDIRLEGDSWICKLDPDSENPHYRLAYYNQRYNAIIPEILARSGAVYCFSDYVWTCYSPEEVAYMTKSSLTDYGIVSAQLPLFNRFREVILNDTYGQDMSAVYNITGKTVKGVEINTTASLFEWWKATYENGGIPGILWSDYLCDGYATMTQRREIAFFVQKLTEAMDTEEGRAWATNFDHDESVLNSASGFTSYDDGFVNACIEEYYKNVR